MQPPDPSERRKPVAGAARPVRIPLPRRFDFGWMTSFLGPREVPSIERVSTTEYRRSTRIGGAPVTLCIQLGFTRTGRSALVVRTAPALPERTVVELVTHMFDLSAHAEVFATFAARDRILAPLVARAPHVRLPQLPDPFEGLVRAILGQQVSVAAASTMVERVVRLAGEAAPMLGGERFLCFPSPAVLAAIPERELLGIGLTRAKTASVRAVARAVAGDELDLGALRGNGAEEVDAALTALPGVGPWTAAYVRMRALGDRDAFPCSDLGIVKAFRAVAGIDSVSAIARYAERWRPWRAYAALHLWQSLGTPRTGRGHDVRGRRDTRGKRARGTQTRARTGPTRCGGQR